MSTTQNYAYGTKRVGQTEIEIYLMKIARQSIDIALHAKKNQTTAVLFSFFYKDTSTKNNRATRNEPNKSHI